jgi:putative addiction module CopG family antidote
MRTIMNISLPTQMATFVRDEVDTGKYGSISEFFRGLVREWQENKLLSELRKSQEDVRNGRGVLLKSLKDLR